MSRFDERIANLQAKIARLEPLEPSLGPDVHLKLAIADLEFLTRVGRESGAGLPERTKKRGNQR